LQYYKLNPLINIWSHTANEGHTPIRYDMNLVQLSHLQRFLEFHHYKLTLVILLV